MGSTMKNIGKGLLWGVGSVVSAGVAAGTAWILYSRKYVNHNLSLDEALEAERKDYLSQHAGRLSYYVDSASKGVPLVLLHSINAAPSAFEMKPIFDHFRAERPVYALDLPGFGFSERSDRIYSPLLYQSAITEFLSEVVGEPTDIVALSLSCEFAALTAVHHLDLIRTLVMISPTGFQPPRADRLSQRARQHNLHDTVYSGLSVGLWNQPFYDLVSSRPSIKFFLDKSFEGVIPDRMVDYAYMTAHQPGAQYAPTYFLSGKLFTQNVRETVYAVLKQPTLVLYDRDPYTNFEMLPLTLRENENWQGCRISPTKGLPHWEEPGKTFEAMQSFWDAL